MTLHTGKLPAAHDPRDLMFDKYVDTSIIDLNGPPPAKTVGHGDRMPKPRLMLGNGPDPSVAPGFGGAGDCVFACITNYIRLAWSISGRGLFPANGATAIANYSEVTGYKLNDPATDNGTNMRTAMNWWRKTGYRDSQGNRHKIGGWASIKLNINHLLWAMYLVDEGVPSGIQFPDSAMTQFNNGQPWSPVAGSGIDGGHCILADDDPLDTGDTMLVESWARDQEATLPFLTEYLDEAYLVIDTGGMVNGKTIEGLDAQQLLSDARQFGTVS
jgi:hypothetical protein